VGAAWGIMILGELGLALNLPEIGVILLGILGAVILGFLFSRTRDLFVMVATAYNGAAQLIFGLGLDHAAPAIGIGPGQLPGSCSHGNIRLFRLRSPIHHVQRPTEVFHLKKVAYEPLGKDNLSYL
jgi:ABC-type uncharacterized transport system permease subunit